MQCRDTFFVWPAFRDLDIPLVEVHVLESSILISDIIRSPQARLTKTVLTRDERRPMRRMLLFVLLMSLGSGLALCQTLTRRPAPAAPPLSPSLSAHMVAGSIPLAVPAGTPLKVALDKDVRIQKAGQKISGKTLEPVYVFDKQVIPAGSEILGRVVEIQRVSKERRTLAAMNGDFSPPHQTQIEFNELLLPAGQRILLKTNVFPGSVGVLQFVPAGQNSKTETQQGKEFASRKIDEVRQEAKRDWNATKQQLHDPGKMHRLERYAVAQLPYHPQYMEKGAGFDAELREPLDFGTEPINTNAVNAIGTRPPSGSLVHAVLVTSLSSARNKKDDPVEAIITQPLIASGQLLLPEGSRLKGVVMQVRRARRLNRNGQLRIVFRQVVPSNGIEQNVEASLEGVAVDKGEHLSLDSEGGAQVTTPKTRYLTTAIAVALASSSVSPDHDRVDRDGGGPDAGGGAANGASGFGFLGAIISAASHSRVISSGFGFYGASVSVYSHFLARGRDVVYPKDMSMVIGFGARTRETKPTNPTTARGTPELRQDVAGRLSLTNDPK